MRFRTRLSCSLLTFALACTHAPAARASNDGDLCSGLAMLVCVPVFLVAGIAQAFEPKSQGAKMYEALRDNDAERARRVLLRATPDERAVLLGELVSGYLATRDDKDAIRLALVTWLLDERQVDLSGPAGSAVLQRVVWSGPMAATPEEGPRTRQLAAARLLIAHGARADAVALGDCSSCNTDPEFLGMMMQAGADLNRAGNSLSLFNQMVERGNLEGARQLLALGADPNGRPAGGSGLLQRIAANCDLRPGHCGCSGTAPQRCIAQSIERTRFAVANGADPNGQATWEHGRCETPYAVAVKLQNTALADALRELGADPDFGARCLAAPHQP